MKNKSLFHVFTNGLLNENPTFRLLLGMCPTLAISTAASSGVGMGLGFTCSLTLLSSVREIIGSGKWFGMQIMPDAYKPMSVIITPSGGFLTLGILLLIVNGIVKYIGKRKQMKARGEIA